MHWSHSKCDQKYSKSFYYSKTIETGLSHFHKLTIFKEKEFLSIEIIKFCNETFRENLIRELSS